MVVNWTPEAIQYLDKEIIDGLLIRKLNGRLFAYSTRCLMVVVDGWTDHGSDLTVQGR